MKIHVIDTYKQIEEYKNSNNRFSLDAWKKYADSISPSLYQKCFDDAAKYDFEKDVVPVLNDALQTHYDRVTSAHNALNDIAKTLPHRASEMFNMDLDITIIFYLGLCNGAGWATVMDGKQTILLGAEKIAELKWHELDTMGDLICHEIAHLIHFALRGNIARPNKAVWQLYSEGIATLYSQKLYKEGFYHQNQNGWLDFCRENIAAIKDEYLKRLTYAESTADFFGDWNLVMGKSNLGYYLGSEFIRYLEIGLSLSDIACLSYEAITTKLYSFLEE
ncbi:MAG: hypothetical protein PHD46_01790 [Eubacteriales bacterium]|nr:hypothetical protein [Eubacteriales bacterium]HBR31009.1 hypothetical protein [Clostridiales bacterium]